MIHGFKLLALGKPAWFPTLGLLVLALPLLSPRPALGNDPTSLLDRLEASSEEGVHMDRLLVSGGVAAACLAAYATYGFLYWWDEKSKDFHYTREGNMEQDSYAGGSDKFGHSWACYVLHRAFFKLLRWCGAHPLLSTVVSAAIVQTAFFLSEVEDAFFDYGFSAWDFAFNLFGSVLAAALDLLPWLDDLFDFRLTYWPTSRLRDADWNPAEDFTGQKYFLVLRLGGVPGLASTGFRFLELHVGYFATGYKPRRPTKERHVFVGLSIDVLRVLTEWLLPALRAPAFVTDAASFVLEVWQPYPIHTPVMDWVLPK